MKIIKFIFWFLILNFGALWLGSLLMGVGPRDEWYLSLNKAPWTPPGYIFGVAWTTIMICFSVYLGYLFSESNNTKTQITYAIQLALNISWNYIFFNQKQIAIGVFVLILLIIVLMYFFFNLSSGIKRAKYLLIPYLFWLCIATSLNLYILIHN